MSAIHKLPLLPPTPGRLAVAVDAGSLQEILPIAGHAAPAEQGRVSAITMASVPVTLYVLPDIVSSRRLSRLRGILIMSLIRKIKIVCGQTLLFCMLFVLSGNVFAGDILVDFADSDSTPVLAAGEKITINKIRVDYTDENGNPATGVFDVVFAWNTDLLALVPVAVSGCYNGELRVQVSSSVTGEPLVGAVVTIGETITQTDDDGIARFTGLEDSMVSVRADATGYVSSGQKVEIPCNQMVPIDMGLMPVH
jgi:hypothetical protein